MSILPSWQGQTSHAWSSARQYQCHQELYCLLLTREACLSFTYAIHVDTRFSAEAIIEGLQAHPHIICISEQLPTSRQALSKMGQREGHVTQMFKYHSGNLLGILLVHGDERIRTTEFDLVEPLCPLSYLLGFAPALKREYSGKRTWDGLQCNKIHNA